MESCGETIEWAESLGKASNGWNHEGKASNGQNHWREMHCQRSENCSVENVAFVHLLKMGEDRYREE